MRTRKPFHELNFCDTFMFAAAMEDPETSRDVLEIILGFPVKKVILHSEHTLTLNPEYRGIRMDVFADDQVGTVYDVEMQTTNKGNLPKRSRYYQGQIDVFDLEPGEDYNKLRNSYIIFICTFDPFGDGLYRYIYKTYCRESDGFLEDGTCKVFLNTKGTKLEGVNSELISFLRFVEKSGLPPEETEETSQRLLKLHKRIAEIKRNRRMEERYMVFDEMLKDERAEGREEGLEAGRSEGLAQGKSALLLLLKAMQKAGESLEEMLPRLESEPAFMDEMIRKYQIKV